MGISEIKGNLIELALENKFDVIAHGCNCFCKMKAGIAIKMAETFACNLFDKELKGVGDINKLGNIDDGRYIYYIDATNKKITVHEWHKGDNGLIFYEKNYVNFNKSAGKETYRKSVNDAEIFKLCVVNAYTQYEYGKDKKPFDYEAFTLCMRKINFKFKGLHIGLPQIGAGLAGGDWNRIYEIIKTELKDCKTTIVYYEV